MRTELLRTCKPDPLSPNEETPVVFSVLGTSTFSLRAVYHHRFSEDRLSVSADNLTLDDLKSMRDSLDFFIRVHEPPKPEPVDEKDDEDYCWSCRRYLQRAGSGLCFECRRHRHGE
jgi:hypothetical protein